jgi:hypothetical protein
MNYQRKSKLPFRNLLKHRTARCKRRKNHHRLASAYFIE